jgi:hypothetical protein
MAYQLARDTSMPVRVLITNGALIVGLAVTHILVVFIVIFVIIPRLKPGSSWSREVASYMATNTPGEW